jgi:hypothetical protein
VNSDGNGMMMRERFAVAVYIALTEISQSDHSFAPKAQLQIDRIHESLIGSECGDSLVRVVKEAILQGGTVQVITEVP